MVTTKLQVNVKAKVLNGTLTGGMTFSCQTLEGLQDFGGFGTSVTAGCWYSQTVVGVWQSCAYSRQRAPIYSNWPSR